MGGILGLLIILALFALSGYLGYLVFTGLFDLFVPHDKGNQTTFIDKSVHYHQHLTIVKKDEVLNYQREVSENLDSENSP